MRKLQKEINTLKNENQTLRNRIWDNIKSTGNGERAEFYSPQKLNQSVAVPLSGESTNCNTNSCGHVKMMDRTGGCKNKNYVNRAISYSNLPKYLDVNSPDKRMKPSPQRSCKSLNKLSFIFRESKRSKSNEKVIGDFENGSWKYCESCKYKVWRKKALTYDPQKLIDNRDLIRSIKCVACNKVYEAHFFVNHCKDCRLTKGVPSFRNNKILGATTKTEMITWDNLDNSISSSPQNIFNESRFSSNNKDLYIHTDDDVLLNGQNNEMLDPNQTLAPKALNMKDLDSANKHSKSSNKLFTPRTKNIFNKRRMFDLSETSHKVLAKKKMSVGSDSEDTYFVSDNFKDNKLTSKDLISTINAFEACDSAGLFLNKTSKDYNKEYLSRKLNHQKKNINMIEGMKKKNIPSLKITKSVLANR